MSEVHTVTARLGAPPATVYRALTDPAALRAWLAEHASVEIPGRFEFWGRYTPQGSRGRQRLLAAEPDQRLAFAWTLDDTETTTDIRLTPDGGGTTLTLSQSGVPTVEEMVAHTGSRDGLHTLHTFWALAIGTLAEYVEGRSLTPKCDFSRSRPAGIRVEVDIDAPADEVFASLIDPDRIRRWFGWEAEVEPWVGGRMTLGADGRIFEFEPGRKLAYRDTDMVTTWELTGSGGRTRLVFVQSGFTADELDNAAQHEAGWLSALAELKRLHALGDTWRPTITDNPT